MVATSYLIFDVVGVLRHVVVAVVVYVYVHDLLILFFLIQKIAESFFVCLFVFKIKSKKKKKSFVNW